MSGKSINENIVKDLGLILIEIERLKKKKIGTYIYFLSFIGIGCVLIYIEKDFIQELDLSKSSPYMKYSEFAISFMVILTGFILFHFAFKRLIKYREKKKEVKLRKAKIDAVLDKHQIKYSCNIVFGEKYHGIQDIIVELKSNSDLLKDSKATYQI